MKKTMFSNSVWILAVSVLVLSYVVSEIFDRRTKRESREYLKNAFPPSNAIYVLSKQQDWNTVQVLLLDYREILYGEIGTEGLELYEARLNPKILYVVPFSKIESSARKTFKKNNAFIITMDGGVEIQMNCNSRLFGKISPFLSV